MMRTHYEIDFGKGIKRSLPLCRVNDTLYIGAFVIYGDVELTVHAAERLLLKAPEFDIIITAESKGIPICYEMSRQSGKPYLVANKNPKLYMKEAYKVEVRSITTEKKQQLYMDAETMAFMKDKKILIVDDVISTGNSVVAIEKLVREAGGKTAGRMAILAEGEAVHREDIIYLEKLPLFNPGGTEIK